MNVIMQYGPSALLVFASLIAIGSIARGLEPKERRWAIIFAVMCLVFAYLNL